ncbi:hypothetical protein BDN71DRAFT_772744 [Pleurotus eryngii]|uniref:Uncharacterized protein n=1 Tax=Pleurotus eryngii TaxID=5323 RepID=A0A9P6D7V1_PLEER|nr:hypothetical protein BDN71DRAFT_772744 [Pleurotus eryngii]
MFPFGAGNDDVDLCALVCVESHLVAPGASLVNSSRWIALHLHRTASPHCRSRVKSRYSHEPHPEILPVQHPSTTDSSFKRSSPFQNSEDMPSLIASYCTAPPRHVTYLSNVSRLEKRKNPTPSRFSQPPPGSTRLGHGVHRTSRLRHPNDAHWWVSVANPRSFTSLKPGETFIFIWALRAGSSSSWLRQREVDLFCT